MLKAHVSLEPVSLRVGRALTGELHDAKYQDEAFRYERRPSVWVQPLADWGKGRVFLVEIPTADETFDNIVAFWNPERPAGPGAELRLAYRLHWGDEMPDPWHEPTEVEHG